MLSKFDEDFIKRLRTENININQRRVINAHDAIDPDDYVTKRQLDDTVTTAINALPAPGGSSSTTIELSGDGVIIYTGTLSPDTKPILTILDANKVLFYSTDFDRVFRWTGTTWLEFGAIPRAVEWLIFAPEGNGHALCNGATVTRSKPDGTTISVNLPNLIGQYIRGASSYSGTQIPPVAPTFSAGVTSSDGAHTHTITSGGAHNHTGLTNAGVEDGAHFHLFDSEASFLPDHNHDATGSSDTAGNHSHNVSASGSGITGSNTDCVAVTAAGEPLDSVADCTHDHSFDVNVLGSTDGSGDHSHGITVSVGSLTIPGIALEGETLDDDNSKHVHAISTEAAHDHGGVTGSNGAHIHTVTGVISDTATPATVELMPYFRL